MTKLLSVLTMVTLSMGGAIHAADEAAFCADLRKLDWRDDKMWQTAVAVETDSRILPSDSVDEADQTKNVFRQLDALLAPARMSANLKDTLLEVGEADFVFKHISGTDLYYFGNTQGSANCSYDTWAEKRGDEVYPLKGPFFSDAECGDTTYFGTFGGKSIILEFQYVQKAPLEWGDPKYVSVAVANKRQWGQSCVIEINP